MTLTAERPVVETKTVPVERVRAMTEKVTEEIPLSETVRREEAELDKGER